MSDLMKNLETALKLGNEAYCFVDRGLLLQCQNKIVDQAFSIEQLEANKAELVEFYEKAVKRLENSSAFYEGSPANERDRDMIAKHKVESND